MDRFVKAFVFSSFTNTSGKIVRLSDFREEVVLIDTWHFHCSACVYFHETLENKVKPAIRSNDFVVISMFRDVGSKEHWMKEIKKGQMASEKDVNLHAYDEFSGSKGVVSDFSKYYYPFLSHGDPNLLLIDKDGKLVGQLLHPVADDAADLIAKIKSIL